MSARKVILSLALLASINLLAMMVNGQWSMVSEAAPADTITDGKPRYSVRKTGTEDTKDLKKKTADLKDPDNLKTEVIYDEKDNTYTIGTSLVGDQQGSGAEAAAQETLEQEAAPQAEARTQIQAEAEAHPTQAPPRPVRLEHPQEAFSLAARVIHLAPPQASSTRQSL